MKKDYLSIQKVSKDFLDKRVLNSISVDIPLGRFVSLLGPSGSGKTTLLMILAGIEKASSGKIYFKDKDLTSMRLEDRGIGVVFQNYALFPNLTIKENILYGLVGKVSSEKIQNKYKELMELVNLKTFSDRFPHELSGGQQQRVAIARALAMEPDLLLLDEPLSALDPLTRGNIGNELKEIQRKSGVTMLMVTHDCSEALSLSDFIVVMNDGVVEQTGSPKDIYDNPCSKFIATFIGGMNILTLPQVNNGAPTGVRYSDVNLLELTESNLKKDNSLIGRIEGMNFLGDSLRIRLKLNDFQTVVTAEVARTVPFANSLESGKYVVVNFPESVWKTWKS